MVGTADDLRSLVSAFLAGEVKLEALDEAVRETVRHRIDEPERVRLWGCLELLLALHETGRLDDRELRDEVTRLL